MKSALTTPDPTRRHDIDALRVLAFGLLILYHVGMFYVADWHWHVKSQHLAEWVKWPMLLVNQWRMPLLFLISGFAAYALLQRRGPGRFAASRTRRLLIPLIFGMAVIVPPQVYLQALDTGAFQGSYGAFLWRYATLRSWPADAFDGAHIGVTWNHLWYLPYLLCYSLLLATLQPLLHSRATRAIGARLRPQRGLTLWLLPALPLILASWALAARFPSTHDLVSDWFWHAVYLTFFLYGYWLSADTAAWPLIRRTRHGLLMAAVGTFAAYVYIGWVIGPTPGVARTLFEACKWLNAWTWILLVLAWGHHLLNRPFRWLPYATEAVYPWYVLHQTVIVVAGVALSELALGPVWEPLLIVIATVVGCGVAYESLIRRVGWVRPLFGLRGRAPARMKVLPAAAPGEAPRSGRHSAQ